MSGHTEVQMTDKLKGKIQQLLCNIPACASRSEENKSSIMSQIHTALCISVCWFPRPPALPCVLNMVPCVSQKKGRHWASAEVGERFIIRIRCDGEGKTGSRLENTMVIPNRAQTHNLKHQGRVNLLSYLSSSNCSVNNSAIKTKFWACDSYRQHGAVWNLLLHGYILKNGSVRAVLNRVFYKEVWWRGAKVHKIGAGYAQSLHDSEREERGGERETVWGTDGFSQKDCSPGWFPYMNSDICIEICRIMMPVYRWDIKPKQQFCLTEYVCAGHDVSKNSWAAAHQVLFGKDE